jgi:hypothetical protein
MTAAKKAELLPAFLLQSLFIVIEITSHRTLTHHIAFLHHFLHAGSYLLHMFIYLNSLISCEGTISYSLLHHLLVIVSQMLPPSLTFTIISMIYK